MRHTVDIKSAPKLSFAAVITAFLGGVFMLIGFAAPYWVTNDFPMGGTGNMTAPRALGVIGQPVSASWGLWHYCFVYPSGRVCQGYPLLYTPLLVELESVAALMFAGTTGVFVLFYVMFPHLRNWKTALMILICSGVTVLLNLVVLVFVATRLEVGSSLGLNTGTWNKRLGWAWTLSCTGAGHYVILAMISLVLCLKRSQEKRSTRTCTQSRLLTPLIPLSVED